MAAKYEIDEKVTIEARIVSSTSDETGTVYQVKMVSQGKTVTQFFKEDEIGSATPSA